VSHDHLSMVSCPLDGEVAAIAHKLEHKVMVGGRGDFEAVLCKLLARDEEPQPRTLDLIGHSTSDDSLLRFGDWVIDGRKVSVRAFFRELADHDVFARLGITSLRLLGCETATTKAGRTTLRTLAEILGLEVFGSIVMLDATHYDETGFCSDHNLIAARAISDCAASHTIVTPVRRTLDIDALPATPLRPRGWPVRIADLQTAASVLRLIRRNEGGLMPGLDAQPDLEVCLPVSTKPGWYAVLQIVHDGSFVRVYPEPNGPGVVFPVSDPPALLALVRDLSRHQAR
jgi:hypothetical protein